MTEEPAGRSPELLSRGASRLVVVDVQERLLPAIADGPAVVAACLRLVQGAGILGVPAFCTEQYPQGLGGTVAPLAELLPTRLSKLRFSAQEALHWGTAGEQTDDRFQVVVTGIEVHVCVLQTAFDLLADGYRVYIPADAVGSRRESDKRLALDRLSAGGAIICSSESVLFEWCAVAGTAEFKQISRLIKAG